MGIAEVPQIHTLQLFRQNSTFSSPLDWYSWTFKPNATGMEGILQFNNTEGSGSFQLYRKRTSKRTKSGCLSCRARHTKCDESRPICGGCARNHLLCSWPNSEKPRKLSVSVDCEPWPSSRKSASISLFPVASPGYAPSLWPRLRGKPDEQRLFQHYTERSAQRLVSRAAAKNPFLSYVLPLAYQNDGFLHIIFAISASHMSYYDKESHAIARSHYAVALRATKHFVTDLGNGVRSSPLEVVLMLLLLCNFEVIDGNTEGAVMQHLRPWSALLAGDTNILDEVDADCACFIAEQFMFIGLVNQYLGLGHEPRHWPGLSSYPDKSQLPYRSYYYGRNSGCTYELYELVPQIATFATIIAQSSPRHLDLEILNEFYSIEEMILLWSIPESSNPTQTPGADEVTAAVFLQMALLVTLQCALNGPGAPSNSIKSQINSCVHEARNFLKLISPSSMSWAILLWPLLHIGSCIVHPEEQEDYVSTVLKMENKVPCCASLIDFLSKLWKLMGEDKQEFYGPYGIRELMNAEKIHLSLG